MRTLLYEFLQKPSTMLIIMLIILIFSRYILKFKYVSCFDIIIKHIKSFSNDKGKFLLLPFSIYFIMPAIISFRLASLKVITDNDIQIITVIVSILTGMLFTLLTLTIDLKLKIVDKQAIESSKKKIMSLVIKEAYYAIMFEIITSIFILILCFIRIFSNQFDYIESLLLYYSVFVLLINLFIVLKRIFKITEKNMDL